MTPRAGRQVDDKTLSRAGLPLERGAIAQLVERVLCKHEVVGSIPSGSTISKQACELCEELRDRGITSFRPGLAGGGISDIVN